MRWSIIRLIWLRELRDQLRDRRTLFMIVVLPLLLYPVLGFAVLQFALSFRERPSVIGVVRGPAGSDDFPERHPAGAGRSVGPVVAWLSLTPDPGSSFPAKSAAAFALATMSERWLDLPLLIRDGKLSTADSGRLEVVFLNGKEIPPGQEKKIDLILSASTDFFDKVARPAAGPESDATFIEITPLRQDELYRQTLSRLQPVLERWKSEIKKVQLARKGVAAELDAPFAVKLPGSNTPAGRPENLLVLLIRIFPFMLVMWSLAGALYPAVDLCAGEKERGTMETLLISPAGREEIVLGKFLTIWLFSAGTALVNLLSMGVSTWQLSAQFMQSSFAFGALFWCVLLALPLSAFFSAVALAIGVYARSSKEGQYYLMPLFIVTMPLIFLTLAPGVELNPFYSLVPVTGVALLMQRLMTAPTLADVPWLYFIPVLAPVALYSWVALRWAIFQFQREEVLFREAERLDIRLWLRRLFREKEALPTMGQAFFCFGVIIGLRWLSLGMGQHLPALVHSSISLMAFVATPALLMCMLLNTRPVDGLRLRWPERREIAVAAVLALLLLPPLAWLAHFIFEIPELTQLLEDRQPLLRELERFGLPREFDQPSMLAYLMVFGLLTSVCEELAFRGFILSGLMRAMRQRNAILLSSFLFALYHMNVFQFLPAFLLGVVLGLLTVRSKSLVPAVIFHLLHNSMLIVSMYTVQTGIPEWVTVAWPAVIALCMFISIAMLWQLYRRPYILAQQEQQEPTRL